MSATNLSMPLEGDDNLNTGSPSGIPQTDDPGVLDNGVGVVVSTFHSRFPVSSDPTPLDSVVNKGQPEEQQIPPSRYWLDFKPGYERGLLAILVKTAETLVDQRDKPGGSVQGYDFHFNLDRSSTAEDTIWAKKDYRRGLQAPRVITRTAHKCIASLSRRHCFIFEWIPTHVTLRY